MAIRDIFGLVAQPRRLVICTGPCCDGQGLASSYLAELRGLLVERPGFEVHVASGSCIRRSCLGKCTDEPLASVEPDKIWYRGLSAQVLLRIYDEHVLGGRALPEFVLADDDP